MENLTTITILALLGTIIVLSYALYNTNKDKDRLSDSLDHLLERYQTKAGGTTMYNGKMLNYNLHSFDGGKIWYACEYGKDWELIVLGKSEEVYPGLLKHLEAWDKLTRYVEENGAIGSKPITEEQKQMLRDANFTVEEKK